ncbi:GntR family transcriptional regulator [Lentzea cavernae]|uniref:GntR family transcriptional regulator n=1 Tax=Lentzea cavernae TaxID=2020703 RepID=A0ABQ3MEJ0_9PSEU|nr:GntR family transcriptional regulator [Lentzea cavernae]GHH35845.1 GntR family transcriptional regulator [Lentzea cavernae]
MTSPRIVVDVENGVAPWRQVRDQLVRLISGGVLPVGSRLPTIRQLAADLGLAAGTVARAYRELEVTGVITTGRRQGTVVAALPSHAPDPLSAAAAEFVAIARSLGASEGEALNAVRARYLGE